MSIPAAERDMQNIEMSVRMSNKKYIFWGSKGWKGPKNKWIRATPLKTKEL
jgi:hypothetical protein